MNTLKSIFLRLFCCGKMLFLPVLALCLFIQPAHADILEAYNLAPFVPLVLETMMNIATYLYDFFVGKGNGIIYIFIYAFVGFYIILYLVKMYLPKDWLSFFGFSGGGEMWDGKADGFSIASNVLKPCLRAIIAAVILLQIKPVYVTEILVNPFLEFGSLYTENILQTISNTQTDNISVPTCPASIEESGWISKNSCEFLIQPVHTITKENNKIIKYGFDFLTRGLRSILIPHGGENILNIITGILLIWAFVSSNVFMALLIIQGIFDFCLSLIMYPFNVVAWVAKKSDKWFDILPAFSQIIDSLKKLVITMIACAFILCVNIAVIRALFNWSSSVFVAAAGGVATSNVPTITNTAMNFGQHSMLWLSSILTFFLMQNIFKMTRERLDLYTKDTSKDIYKNVTGDAKTMWDKIKSTPDTIKNIVGGVKKVSGK
nr:hypothetical protein [Candidatus Enterousia merdequi]